MILKRLFDLACSLPAAILLALPMLLVALLVKLTSPGPILYWSDRVGRNNTIFRMPKFRTMRTDTPLMFALFSRCYSKLSAPCSLRFAPAGRR